MKLVKILAITLLALPLSASARGFLVPVIPTASITVGGQQAFTVTTGEKIPIIRWKSVNGTDFKTTLSVNNPALCGGIKDNQPWGQGRTAAGDFDLGIAPKAREGCVLTFAYEVKSRTGHQRVDRAVLRYVAPKATPAPIKPPVKTTNEDLKIQFIEVGSGDKVFPGSLISTRWSAEGLKSTDEVKIYIDRADHGPIKGESSRIHHSVRNFTLEIPKSAEYGEHVIVIGVIREGDMIKTFESKPFIVYGQQIKDVLKIVSPTKEVFSVGETMEIRWTGYEPDLNTYSIHLMDKDSSYEKEIVSNINISKETPEDAKVFYWTIPDDIGESEYYIELRSKAFGVESSEFKIEKDDTPLEIKTEFVSESSTALNDDNTIRDFNISFNINPTKDIYVTDFVFSGTPSSMGTTTPGFFQYIEGSSMSMNSLSGVRFYPNITPIRSGPYNYYKIPKNVTTNVVFTTTISSVGVSGQYRAGVTGFRYLTSLNQNFQESGSYIFLNSPESIYYRTSYRTINSNGFFSSIFEKINSLGSSLGSVFSGAVKVFQFF